MIILIIYLHIVPFPKHNHCITYFPIVLFQNIQLSKVICLLLRAFIKRLTKWWLSCVVSSFKIQCDVRNKIFGRNEKFIFYSVFSRFIFRKIFSKMCMCIYKQCVFTMYLVMITMYVFNVVQYYNCTNNFLCFVKHFHVNVSKKTVVTNYYLTKLVTTK